MIPFVDRVLNKYVHRHRNCGHNPKLERMQHRITNYKIRHVREIDPDGLGGELVPVAELFYLDSKVAEYVGWSVAYFLMQLSNEIGTPIWSPPVLLDVRVVRCTCRRNVYVCSLE